MFLSAPGGENGDERGRGRRARVTRVVFLFLLSFEGFLLIYYRHRENFSERVCDIGNVSCAYQCGYFSVIDERCINRDAFSSREIIV